MGKYEPLAQFLSALKRDEWDASFSDVEKALGHALPPSASQYQAWWANQSGGQSQTQGWMSVGWKTTALDLPRRRVRFVRERPQLPYGEPEPPRIAIDSLWSRAKTLTGIQDRDEILGLALEALIARETASHLVALGGSMPDFETPARDRP